ncbi:MAG: cofactor-independent phosphoglycerate mutase [Bacteroidaceae bacterium]|nr:cofactor-independent phosphoglycerate mutase [Bacteroidaceae bacterium]
MKHIIILGDGMADWPVESLGNKTLLQYANTPYMDKLAKMGRCGMLKTVQDGFHPGSEVANSSILGYDQNEVYEGRGPLEAASIGVDLAPEDMAIRCNIITLEDGKIVTHNGGNLQTEDAAVLIDYLNEHLATDRVKFYCGVQYRHLLVIKGGNKHVVCQPPHDHPGEPWRPLLVTADSSCAGQEEESGVQRMTPQETADLLNDLILRSQELLARHPYNVERVKRGERQANSIWPWAGGYRPHMVPLTETFPQIKRGAVITAVDLIRGIGTLAGLRVIDVPGATGLADTNYEGKAQAAIKALETDDFVYVHVEASDEAGHDGDLDLKLKTIEYLDSRIVGPVYEAVKEQQVAIAVLPDHPTPVAHRTHTNEPIPFLIYAPGMEADKVETFDEVACKQGSYGQLEKDEFIKELMKIG